MQRNNLPSGTGRRQERRWFQRWKRRTATRWLMKSLAGDLDENCTGSGNFGHDSQYPGVSFEFFARTCPPDCWCRKVVLRGRLA
jgi:hypothetical protein